MAHYILLTGAGFSRNWGGWLADEAFVRFDAIFTLNQDLLMERHYPRRPDAHTDEGICPR
jgi:hypothetical protein